jgi:hypothetical protein
MSTNRDCIYIAFTVLTVRTVSKPSDLLGGDNRVDEFCLALI